MKTLRGMFQSNTKYADLSVASRTMNRPEDHSPMEECFGLGQSPKGMPGESCCAASPTSTSHTLGLAIICSSLWSEGDEEDIWHVEVAATASIAEVKSKITEVYGVPEAMQRLQAGPDPGDACFNGTTLATDLAQQPFYLLPAANDGDPRPEQYNEEGFGAEQDLDDPEIEMQEQAEAARALQESLQGVMYKVNFLRPDGAGGHAAGKRVCLELDALAMVCDAQAMVEVELFGAAGSEPAHLAFNGQPLPPQIPLHCAGIGDGDTVIVESSTLPEGHEFDYCPPFGEMEGEFEQNDDEDGNEACEDPVLRWAAI